MCYACAGGNSQSVNMCSGGCDGCVCCDGCGECGLMVVTVGCCAILVVLIFVGMVVGMAMTMILIQRIVQKHHTVLYKRSLADEYKVLNYHTDQDQMRTDWEDVKQQRDFDLREFQGFCW